MYFSWYLFRNMIKQNTESNYFVLQKRNFSLERGTHNLGLSSKGQVPSGPQPAGELWECLVPTGPRATFTGRPVGSAARVLHCLILGESGMNEGDQKSDCSAFCLCLWPCRGVGSAVKRKCNTDAHPSHNGATLVKAVKCQQEGCATVLLSTGAHLNVAHTAATLLSTLPPIAKTHQRQ